MVGCCKFGPFGKKQTYEFNNPAYAPNKAGGTYRHSQALSGEEVDGAQAQANGATAQLKGYATHPDGSASNGAVDFDAQSPSVPEGAVVAIETSSVHSDKSDGKHSDVKQDSKRSSSSSKGSKKSSKRNSKDSNDNNELIVVTNEETGVTTVTEIQSSVRSSSHESEAAGSDVINKRESQRSESSGVAVPYSDASHGNDDDVMVTRTTTTVVTHDINGDNQSDKRISSTSSVTSSPRSQNEAVTYDLGQEGHFHSEHGYTTTTTENVEVMEDEDGHIVRTVTHTVKAVHIGDIDHQGDTDNNSDHQVESGSQRSSGIEHSSIRLDLPGDSVEAEHFPGDNVVAENIANDMLQQEV